jgi:hypothetical protein
MSQDRQQIEQLIETAYIDGIHTSPNLETVLSGFHTGFRMLVQQDEDLKKVSPEEFVRMVIKRRQDDPAAFADPVTFEIPFVEVTGDAAAARVDLSRGGRHIFTDYLLLYRTKNGWRIVSKVFHAHA